MSAWKKTPRPERSASGVMSASTPAGKPRKRRPEPSPAQRALGLLVRREHSRKELARKLATCGVSREDAYEAVARMTAEGWQDDARFAESLARMRAMGGHGPVRIRAELETHGLDSDVIAQAFQALADAGEDDWLEHACQWVSRRHGAGCADDPVLRRKAIDFLIRRGFDVATAHAATSFSG